jgi:SAM-dependent methyltransferase
MHDAWTASLPAGVSAGRVDLLSLGVTPEIALFSWAPDLQITALDSSEDMIRSVWPGENARRRARQGDWLKMPLPDAAFDLIVNDTGLVLLVEPERLSALGKELRRVLRQDGRVVMRHFSRPASPETPQAIAEAAAAGRLASFHELKLRLLMAVEAGPPRTGAPLAAVYDCFQRHFPDRGALARQLGCDPRTISTIDAYRGRDACYAFHTLDELAAAFDAFELTPGPTAKYPAADLCPVFVLTPKP